MRVLVTGAAGFIGAQVVRVLLSRAHEVGALIRPGSSAMRLQSGLTQGSKRLSLLRIDLDDRTAISESVGRWQPEACLHLAWYAEPGIYLEAPENLRCLESSLDLLEALGSAGCRRVVMAGTCAEYDTEAGWLREEGPVRPKTLYAASKLALDLVGSARARQLGVSFTWARLFYQYGPFEDARRLVPSAILSLLQGMRFSAGSGRLVRDYLHVADVGSALVALTEAGAEGTFNICSGEPITLGHLLRLVGQIVGREELIEFGSAPPRAWDPPFICGDNRRLRAATGWAPIHPLEEGIAANVEWWRNWQVAKQAA